MRREVSAAVVVGEVKTSERSQEVSQAHTWRLGKNSLGKDYLSKKFNWR